MSNIDNTVTPINADRAVTAVRASVRDLRTWATYVTDNAVTRETVAAHADALARLAFPNEEPIQKKDGKRTKFGNAVQAAGNGMRRALDKDETDTDDKPVNLLTRAGLKAELDDVIAAWKAGQENN